MRYALLFLLLAPAAFAQDEGDATRRAAILAASEDSAAVSTTRDTRLLDARALTAATVERLPAGARIMAYSYEEGYWGVRHGARRGYVNGASIAGGVEEQRVVTEGRRAIEQAREAAAAERAAEREAARRAASPRYEARPSVARQCTAIARTTGRQCRRMTTNPSGRCWQHGG